MTLACIRFFGKKNSIGINVDGCEETKADEEKEAPFYVEQEVEANEEELEKYKQNVQALKDCIVNNEKEIQELIHIMKKQ